MMSSVQHFPSISHTSGQPKVRRPPQALRGEAASNNISKFVIHGTFCLNNYNGINNMIKNRISDRINNRINDTGSSPVRGWVELPGGHWPVLHVLLLYGSLPHCSRHVCQCRGSRGLGKLSERVQFPETIDCVSGRVRWCVCVCVCVCVCERERERERESVCVYVLKGTNHYRNVLFYIFTLISH